MDRHLRLSQIYRGVLPSLYKENVNMFLKEPEQLFSSNYFVTVFLKLLWICYIGLLSMSSIFILMHNNLLHLNQNQSIEVIFHIIGIAPSDDIDTATVSYT